MGALVGCDSNSTLIESTETPHSPHSSSSPLSKNPPECSVARVDDTTERNASVSAKVIADKDPRSIVDTVKATMLVELSVIVRLAKWKESTSTVLISVKDAARADSTAVVVRWSSDASSMVIDAVSTSAAESEVVG